MPVEHDTSKANVGEGGGGGGGGGTTYTGSGTPEGVQTGSVGESYYDTTNGGFYIKLQGSATNTGWGAAGAASSDIDSISGTDLTPGLVFDPNTEAPYVYLLADGLDGYQSAVIIGDTAAYESGGTTNGIYYFFGGGDGEQSVQIYLGSIDQYSWLFGVQGDTQLPLGQFSGYPGLFSMGGNNSADYSIFLSGIQTTDDTPTVLQGATGEAYSLQFPTSDFTGLLSGELVARRVDVAGTDSAWTFQGVIRSSGATPTYSWVGDSAPTLSLVAQDSDASTWDATLDIDNSIQTIFVTVTGEVAKNIDWALKLSITDVQ